MSASDDSRNNFSLLQILGWLTGGLSLLNLIEELSPMKIYGNLKKWLDAYTGFVEKVGGFLFGWIDFGWVQVSNLEMHVLVIAIILITAYSRANFHRGRSDHTPILGLSFLFIILVFLPILLLSSWGGCFFSVVGLCIICIMIFAEDDEYEVFNPSRKAILNELIGVAAVFFFLIALNYTVFKSWS